eukprot:TRINITY_DN655_c0_g1_i1.p1 TRINITY_DN655_c0_g1~~TRINITY_DN655_c0_g1_i1.p1  ORF type:complete len:641 (-),score=233.08 TRINITY_DN655_c0_g1_i1:75-1997(-)
MNSKAILLIILYFSLSFCKISPRGHVIYPEVSECDFNNEPCAPLNDIWGYRSNERNYAVVGLSNGIDIIDVTNPQNSFRVNQEKMDITGCLTEWRDIKVYQDSVLFVVEDWTSLCICEEQPCELAINVDGKGMNNELIGAVEGSASRPLSDFPDGVSGSTIYAKDKDGSYEGCTSYEEDLFKDSIALIDRGDCAFSEKILNAQNSGAIGVVIVNHRSDDIYPSMGGQNDGVEIPAVMISKDEGDIIKGHLDEGHTETTTINPNTKRDNDMYSPPDGLVIADVTDPTNVQVKYQSREFFDFSHNIFIDPDRALMYACGMSKDVDLSKGKDERYVSNGGILVFDISDPYNPVKIANYDEFYIHDIEVAAYNNPAFPNVDYILVGCGIYNKTVVILDVTNPSGNINNDVIASFDTDSWPHNSALTMDNHYVYITHEDTSMNVDIWDISDLSSITFISSFGYGQEHETIPHNVFITSEDLMFLSYYSEGVLSYDISDPKKPALIGFYDTSYEYTSGFHGVWGIYPFGPEMNDNPMIYASDIESGCWVLELVNKDKIHVEEYIHQDDGNNDSEGSDNNNDDGSGDSLIIGIGIFIICVIILINTVIIAGAFVAFRYFKYYKNLVVIDNSRDDLHLDISDDFTNDL